MRTSLQALILCLLLSAGPLMAKEKASPPKKVATSEVTGEVLGPYIHRTKVPQEMEVHNFGSLSFQKRLDMIEGARRTIEAEFFIYNIDTAGRIFTQALVKKAREGVRVRVLVDYGWPVAQLDSFYATVLMQNGVEVRYYNPLVSLDLFKGQFRSHRKALIVDDKEAMTGGRNIADEYFDMAADYNFLDRDVVIRGSVARAVRESFDQFWFSNMTQVPTYETLPVRAEYGLSEQVSFNDPAEEQRFQDRTRRYKNGMKRGLGYLWQNQKDRDVLESLRAVKSLNTGRVQTHLCRDTVYAADMPGIGERSRVLFKELENELSKARKSVHVESPYFVATKFGMNLIKPYLARGLDIQVYTNSLNSTDAIYTVAVFYPRIGYLIEAGMKVYIYQGDSIQSQDFITPESRYSRWGMHAKSAVVDEKTVMIGTFNMDPRSRNINSEMAVICRDNPALAADVLRSMQVRKAQSVQLNEKGDPVDGSSRFARVSLPKRIAYYLVTPLSNLLDFLL